MIATTATIEHASSSTNAYKSTSSLQTKRHTVASINRRSRDTTGGGETAAVHVHDDVNEARYWTQKLGLGGSKYDTSKSQSLYACPRSLTLGPPKAAAGAVVDQVLLGPKLGSKHPPLVVVGGPRVSLYATSAQGSAFVRALLQSNSRKERESEGAAAALSSSSSSVEPDRQVPTGGHLARCAAFRQDGRLLAIGTDVGQVRISDVTMRSTLTTFRASSQQAAVRTVQWFRNGQYILAGGDDGCARVWHLSQSNKERPVQTWVGHGDVIRCSALWQRTKTTTAATAVSSAVGKNKKKTPSVGSEWTQIAMTGSYDHTVRVWNVSHLAVTEKDAAASVAANEEESRAGQCLAVLQHGAPVEAICLMKSSHPDVPVWLLSAGGTTVKVWNPFTGHCATTVTTFHRKTVTSMLPVLRANYDDDHLQSQKVLLRILTASLDGVIQFHSWNATTGQMAHLYSTKLPDSITSVATDTTGERLVFGTVSGQVLVRMKGASVVKKKRQGDPRAGTYSFFQRGMNEGAGNGDFTVTTTGKKRKLQKHDLAMKQFRYSDALDEALATRRPRDVMGVLEELGKRRALTPALSNRDEETLEPVLSFILRYIRKPHYTSLLTGVSHRLIDIYASTCGDSDKVDELFTKLRHQVGLETKAQRDVMKLVGQIECIIASGV